MFVSLQYVVCLYSSVWQAVFNSFLSRHMPFLHTQNACSWDISFSKIISCQHLSERNVKHTVNTPNKCIEFLYSSLLSSSCLCNFQSNLTKNYTSRLTSGVYFFLCKQILMIKVIFSTNCNANSNNSDATSKSQKF